MKPYGPDIWTVDQPQTYHGVQVGTRMTVIRLQDQSLMLISPVAIDDVLANMLDHLGSIAHIIAPNDYHHGSLRDCAARYPHANVHVSVGLLSRYADLKPAVLDDQPAECWAGQVDQMLFDGLAVREFSGNVRLNETVFCHCPSRTLILTDAAHHVTAASSFGLKCMARLSGTYRSLAPTLLERIAITERADCKASLQRVLAWDFDAVIMAHGELIPDQGKMRLVAGYQWLLAKPQANTPASGDVDQRRRLPSSKRCG